MTKSKFYNKIKNATIVTCLVALLIGSTQFANAQNHVVNNIKAQNEIVGKLTDILMLNSNDSIKKNYAKIDSLMSMHKEVKFKEYNIMIYGHYTFEDKFYDESVWLIRVSKNYQKYDVYSGAYANSENIIDALTLLYSHSLGIPFNVDRKDYRENKVNTERKRYKAETGRTFKHQNGHETKEYEERVMEVGGQPFYSLNMTSDLYKKIRDKVEQEIGVQAQKYDVNLESEHYDIDISDITKRVDNLQKMPQDKSEAQEAGAKKKTTRRSRRSGKNAEASKAKNAKPETKQKQNGLDYDDIYK